ncbi:TniQ family protein [Lysinibacillus fusiformis]|nr:TniQ family protein [Lysinibacillus fusiformis]
MIGSFPNPYEDELIYSIFARFANRSANLSVRDTLGMFFNDHRSKLTPDFPSNLNEAVKQLSVFEYASFEYLLYNHTPINYFTNFLMTVDKNLIINEVKQKKSQNLQMSIGQVAFTVKESNYFKYCPTCLKNDLVSLGESYWRLSHQLPSVMICSDHKEILHYSSVLYRNKNAQLVCPHLNNCNPSPLSQCVNDAS